MSRQLQCVLLWRVQTFVVIGGVYLEPDHCKILSNFEFDRNIVSGTGAWCSLNNTYQTFLASCIWYTDHLCDFCGLTHVNIHFILSLLPMISKCWLIVTSSIHESDTSNCDITMTDCSCMLCMDAFLSQWRWGQWFKVFVKNTSFPSFVVNCLASEVIVNQPRTTHVMIILQWRSSMRIMYGLVLN